MNYVIGTDFIVEFGSNGFYKVNYLGFTCIQGSWSGVSGTSDSGVGFWGYFRFGVRGPKIVVSEYTIPI